MNATTTETATATGDHRYSVNGVVMKSPSFFVGDDWSELNANNLIDTHPNFDGRFYCQAGENIIRFPVPPYDHQWFRVKKI